MKNQTQFRQGDVLIEKVDALPQGVRAIEREGGRVILAHGEVTGHAHAIVEGGADLFETVNGEHFLRLERPVSVRHEEHAPIPLDAGVYRVLRQREYTPEAVRFVLD